jgi:hypothetical protein
MHNLHFVICNKIGKIHSIHEIVQREIEVFAGKLKEKEAVVALNMALKSNNSPQSSVSTAAVSVLFMNLWHREIYVCCV